MMIYNIIKKEKNAMRKNTIIGLCLLFMALFVNVSKINASETYYDNFDTFENMLRSADIIIIGKVVKINIEEEPYKNMIQISRYSVFEIQDIYIITI